MSINQQEYDIVIIGTGAGGATFGYGIRNLSKRILFIERGDFLPQEPDNWSAEAIFKDEKYFANELHYNSLKKRLFRSRELYYVGGKTKIYGAVLQRFLPNEFEHSITKQGVSPQWCIGYKEMEPFYSQAEKLYKVHGEAYPTTVNFRPKVLSYPYPALPWNLFAQELANDLKKLGVNPWPLPIAIDYRTSGKCVFCNKCDHYVCPLYAKSDAETICMREVLKQKNVTLMTNTKVIRFSTDNTAHTIQSVEVETNDGQKQFIKGRLFVLAAGAINSAAIMLASKNRIWPNGASNSSRLVGKNLMFHNAMPGLAIKLSRAPFNVDGFQKFFQITDIGIGSSDSRPLGNMQLVGRMPLKYFLPLGLKWLATFIENRSFQFFIQSEDFPKVTNYVSICEKGIVNISYKTNNLMPLFTLERHVKTLLKKAGYHLVLTYKGSLPDPRYAAYACGTATFGTDREKSVLDENCKSHDISNLYVVDGSFFPSSGNTNITLTIMANALRVANHVIQHESLVK